MKSAKIILFIALAAATVLSSCKKEKDDDTVVLKSFSFDNSENLVIELSWTTKDGSGATMTNGNSYVDLDLVVDDTVLISGERSGEYGSGSNSEFELLNMSSTAAPKKYYVGVIYYNDIVTPTTGYTIGYTIKVYPENNPAAAQTYSGTLTGVTVDTGKAYFQMFVNKTASGFEFVELASKFSLTGY